MDSRYDKTASYEFMEVNMIVAAGKDGAIGKNGDLIWQISSDLKRFKALTMGHPVIMGRKTWESLPKKPLPGRLNIVVSRNPDFIAEGARVVTTPEDALGVSGDSSPFVMGGEQIYKAFMPYVTKIFLTEIDAECQEADARLTFLNDLSNWHVEDMGDMERTPEGLAYRYVTYSLNK